LTSSLQGVCHPFLPSNTTLIAVAAVCCVGNVLFQTGLCGCASSCAEICARREQRGRWFRPCPQERAAPDPPPLPTGTIHPTAPGNQNCWWAMALYKMSTHSLGVQFKC
jgi:hypothetical protein